MRGGKTGLIVLAVMFVALSVHFGRQSTHLTRSLKRYDFDRKILQKTSHEIRDGVLLPEWAHAQLSRYHITQLETSEARRRSHVYLIKSFALLGVGIMVFMFMIVRHVRESMWLHGDLFAFLTCMLVALYYAWKHGSVDVQLQRDRSEFKALAQLYRELPEGNVTRGALSAPCDEVRGALSTRDDLTAPGVDGPVS